MFSYLKKLSAWPHTTNLKKEKEFQTIFNRALTLSEWGMRDVSIPLYLKARRELHIDIINLFTRCNLSF